MSPVRALVRRLGIRRGTLLAIGVFFLAEAWIILSDPVVVNSDLFFHLRLPVEFRVALWSTAALVAILGSLTVSPRLQGIAFGVAVLPPAQRVLSYGFGIVLDQVGEVGGRTLLALPYMIQYLVTAAAIIAVASYSERIVGGAWPEALERRHP